MSSTPPLPFIEVDKGVSVLVTVVIFTIIAAILTGLRIYSRVRLVSAGLGWDDVSIVLAMASDDLEHREKSSLTDGEGTDDTRLRLEHIAMGLGIWSTR